LPADLYIWNSDGDQFKETEAEGQDLCSRGTKSGILRKDYTLGRFHPDPQDLQKVLGEEGAGEEDDGHLFKKKKKQNH
jgi:hypothetical protein